MDFPNLKRGSLSQRQINRMTKRDYLPYSVQARNFGDVIKRSPLVSESVDLSEGNDVVVLLSTTSLINKKVLSKPEISLYQGSVSADNQIGVGDNVDESMYRIFLSQDWAQMAGLDRMVYRIFIENANSSPALTDRIDSSADDAYDQGATYSDSSQNIGLGKSGDPYISGFRFDGLNIPQGVTITSAKVTFESAATQDGGGDISLDYYAEDADTSAVFSSGDSPDDRTRTTATVNSSVAGFPVTLGENFDSPDLTDLVQEVIDRPGWAIGNALTIIVDGTPSDDNHVQDITSYDKDTAEAALLTVGFDLPVIIRARDRTIFNKT